MRRLHCAELDDIGNGPTQDLHHVEASHCGTRTRRFGRTAVDVRNATDEHRHQPR